LRTKAVYTYLFDTYATGFITHYKDNSLCLMGVTEESNEKSKANRLSGLVRGSGSDSINHKF
jgi:hypothetical protein